LVIIDVFNYRTDAWLTVGISSFLAGLFIKNKFGNNEYRYIISKVC